MNTLTYNDLLELASFQLKLKEDNLINVLNNYNWQFDNEEITTDPQWALEVYYQEIQDFLESKNSFNILQKHLETINCLSK